MSYSIGTRSVWYLGNTAARVVHDLLNERPECHIDEILAAGTAVGFLPDSPAIAREEGFANCPFCFDSRRRGKAS